VTEETISIIDSNVFITILLPVVWDATCLMKEKKILV